VHNAYIVRCKIHYQEAICPKKDILYLCTTKIHKKAKNMSMITTLIPPIAGGMIAACTIIYAATAKRKVPITAKEADILWKMHKKDTDCTSHKMQPRITENGEITGFQCQCGYKYTQQRPLMSRTPRYIMQTAANSPCETSPRLSRFGSRT